MEHAIATGKKLRRARRVARIMSLLPSVRMVAVCNSIAFGTARPGSDVDLFIVVSPCTIAITRALIVTVLAILRLRPQPGRERDAICVGFFVATTALSMRPLSLQGGDPYLALWAATLIPLAERGNTAKDFFDANKEFIAQEMAVEITIPVTPPSWSVCRRADNSLTRFGVAALRLLEPIAERLQHGKFSAEIKKRMNKGSDVVVTREVLKFHTDDRRLSFRNAWYTTEVCRSHYEQSLSSSSRSSRHLEHA